MTTETPKLSNDRILWVDAETTGRHWKRHGIHQLAFLLEVDGRIVGDLDLRMRPDLFHVIDPDALSKSGVTREQIEAYSMSQSDGRWKFAQFAFRNQISRNHPIHLGGWNNRKFDDDFLREFFQADFFDYFFSDTIDASVLAAIVLRLTRRNLPNMQLGTVAAHFGITPDGEFHDALTDVRVTRAIYRHIQGGSE